MSSGPASRLGRGNEFFHRFLVGQIAGRDEGALAQFRGQRVQRVAARARQHDLRALPMQRAGDGGAEAAAGAGDQRDAIVQIKHQLLRASG